MRSPFAAYWMAAFCTEAASGIVMPALLQHRAARLHR